MVKMLWVVAVVMWGAVAMAGTIPLAPDGCAMHPLSSAGCTQTTVNGADGHVYCRMDCTTGQGFTIAYNFPTTASVTAPHFQSSVLALSQSSAGTLCMAKTFFCCSTNWNAAADGSTSCDSYGQVGGTTYSSTAIGSEGGSNRGVWTVLPTPQDSSAYDTHDACYARFDRVASGGGCTDTASTTVHFVNGVLLYAP